jgi:hypothetical protein
LAESSGGEPPEFSIDELRSRGGPFYSAIADALTEEVAAKHAVGAADAFNRLPDSMRRPADIMAVLDYAARQYAIRTDAPDGQFDAPRRRVLWLSNGSTMHSSYCVRRRTTTAHPASLSVIGRNETARTRASISTSRARSIPATTASRRGGRNRMMTATSGSTTSI